MLTMKDKYTCRKYTLPFSAYKSSTSLVSQANIKSDIFEDK